MLIKKLVNYINNWKERYIWGGDISKITPEVLIKENQGWPPWNSSPQYVVTPDCMMEYETNDIHIKEIIDNLPFKKNKSEDSEIIEDLVINVIYQLAAFIQMLPGSAHHHHRGSMGLFAHLLETARFALEESRFTMLSETSNPAEKNEIYRRSKLVVFYAALLHDWGKALTDFRVTAVHPYTNRYLVWDPRKSGIFDWAKENNLRVYTVNYREGRYKEHEKATIRDLYHVIPAELYTYLGHDLSLRLDAVLHGSAIEDPIYKLVKQADQLSVERDLELENQSQENMRLGMGTPIMPDIHKAICTVAKEYPPNDIETPTFVMMNGSLFINWQQVYAKVEPLLKQTGNQAIPLNINDLATIMINDGSAVPFSAVKVKRYHTVKLEGATVPFYALRIVSPHFVYDNELNPTAVPDSINGEIEYEDTDEGSSKDIVCEQENLDISESRTDIQVNDAEEIADSCDVDAVEVDHHNGREEVYQQDEYIPQGDAEEKDGVIKNVVDALLVSKPKKVFDLTTKSSKKTDLQESRDTSKTGVAEAEKLIPEMEIFLNAFRSGIPIIVRKSETFYLLKDNAFNISSVGRDSEIVELLSGAKWIKPFSVTKPNVFIGQLRGQQVIKLQDSLLAAHISLSDVPSIDDIDTKLISTEDTTVNSIELEIDLHIHTTLAEMNTFQKADLGFDVEIDRAFMIPTNCLEGVFDSVNARYKDKYSTFPRFKKQLSESHYFQSDHSYLVDLRRLGEQEANNEKAAL